MQKRGREVKSTEEEEPGARASQHWPEELQLLKHALNGSSLTPDGRWLRRVAGPLGRGLAGRTRNEREEFGSDSTKSSLAASLRFNRSACPYVKCRPLRKDH
ncbi:hypothetical protein EYF80_027160 [Liparis tanakae]|uniref:Uncharacterized protein n=1 Tax=Liparis tanakae TaxID=230148 RepID=A0A4Z2HCY5_9TELE|nr:hypothetical protein EYF80_027160 [Liparis tanakae]